LRIRKDPDHVGKLDPDPHRREKLNPDPYQHENPKRIRVHIKVKIQEQWGLKIPLLFNGSFVPVQYAPKPNYQDHKFTERKESAEFAPRSVGDP
jgi:hypothetical protein